MFSGFNNCLNFTSALPFDDARSYYLFYIYNFYDIGALHGGSLYLPDIRALFFYCFSQRASNSIFLDLRNAHGADNPYSFFP